MNLNSLEKNMEGNMPYNQDPRLRPPQDDGQNNHHKPPPVQKCPRCNSANTKFCYYNNYSLSQPRYYCKSCRRYWTHGGTLRNVPVGGGSRKSKRPRISGTTSSESEISRTQALPSSGHLGQDLMSGLEPGMCDNSFYSGGSLLSSLAALQAINQPLFAASGGSSGAGFGTNMALMQGANGFSLRPQVPPQEFNNELFPSQQISMMNSLGQVFVNRDGSATSAGLEGNLWSGAALEDGDHHACSSFNPNQSSGVDPSQ